ncbi:MAG: prepilin-type N-terminal cleavage/methylation domain-containing protein [Patescibacteria group bacterium]|nr:prepilin-type N-terminal cleavage/methylation domain-containing protein [Patescibacteria group bacterium]
MVGRAAKSNGFTLVETIVSLGVFAIIIVASYQAIILTTRVANAARAQIAAAAVANEQMEVARNLLYGEVGVNGSWPPGRLQATKTVVRDNRTFTVNTTVRSIDDPFDGTIGGSPNDTAPGDYKLVDLRISCSNCKNYTTQRFNTWVGPISLESSSTNGALFIRAFDASGIPLPGADVHVVNSSASPPFTIDDVTNNDGILQLVDVPPGVKTYQITVSKSGYSTDRTYTADGGNPNPTKPHATVSTATLTQASFSIDVVGSMDVASVDTACSAVANAGFKMTGAKLIGTPSVYKYNVDHVTDASGVKNISDVEWDSYSFSSSGATYDVIGTIPLAPIGLNPGANQQLKVVVAPKNSRRLVVAVRDNTTKQPLTDASVRLTGPSSYDQTQVTDRGYLMQTDWVGGSGQADFTNATKYWSQDTFIKTSTAGQLQLVKYSSQHYYTSGNLTSSTFDLGAPTDFNQILWYPQNQPSQVGADSVRMQIATNNDNATWDFVGPDGTAGTYYTVTNPNLWTGHDGNQYLRYKVYLRTANEHYTPTVSDVMFSFTSACVPPGQVSFAGLASGTFTATVTKSGYTTKTQSISVSPSWQLLDISMTPL